MLGTLSFNIIEFINFYLMYVIVFNIRFTDKKLRYLMVVCGSLVINFFVYVFMDKSIGNILTAVLGILSAIVLTESKRYKVVLLFPFVYFISSLINVTGSYVLAYVMNIKPEQVYESPLLTFVSECTAVIILLIWSALNKNRERKEIHVTAGQYIWALLGVVCLLFVIGFVQGLILNEFDFLIQIKEKLVLFTTILAFCFVGLNFTLHNSWKKNIIYKTENEKYDMFINKQEAYIKRVILEDERRRKIKHDMNAHILAMSIMLKNKQYDELNSYFEELKELLDDSNVKKYTGIMAVDSVISEFYCRAEEIHTACTWEGYLNSEGNVTVFELCVLFSNLLGNAVEAIEQADGERKLDVYAENVGENIVITIGNSCKSDVNIMERPTSKKGDNISHGLGLRNVEEIINKHNGSIKYCGQAGWFQVNIVI